MSSPTRTIVNKSNVTTLSVPAHTDTHPTAADKASQTAYVEHTMQADEIASLRAEQKRIREQLKSASAAHSAAMKEARANAPSRLEREIARQEKAPKWLIPYLTGLVANRVKYGQDQATAINAVLALFKERIVTGLEQLDTEQAAQAAMPAAEVVTSK